MTNIDENVKILLRHRRELRLAQKNQKVPLRKWLHWPRGRYAETPWELMLINESDRAYFWAMCFAGPIDSIFYDNYKRTERTAEEYSSIYYMDSED